MGNPKDKEAEVSGKGESAATREARDAHHAAHGLSQEREASDTTLAKQVAEAIVREMAKLLHITRPYSMREVQLQCQPALR